jgi:hypothetical protein
MEAQRAGTFLGSTDDPAIKYATAPVNNLVADVNRQLQAGALRSRSKARRISAVGARGAADPRRFAAAGLLTGESAGQTDQRTESRAVFFNDRVALGWVRGGDLLEVAAHDERRGVVFYTLDQRAEAPDPPQFKRAFICLGCHMAGDTLGVPGFLMFSTTRPNPRRDSACPFVDQTDSLERRFGGWFVTGSTGERSTWAMRRRRSTVARAAISRP